MSVVYFLLLVGVLVVIHELGHFVAAKLLDFQVQRFSIGFGRALFRVRIGETEYQLALLPLGGYVRILGEDTGEDETPSSRRAFNAKPLWQRLIVVFAGPAANLLFPVFIYFIFFAGHSQLPAAVIGDVLAGGPAERAGIEAGDRVVAIDGAGLRYWEDLESRVQSSIGTELRVTLARGERELDKYIVPVEQVMRRRDGSFSRQGLIGVTHAPFLPLVGVIDPASPAAAAGLRTGDLVVSVDGELIESWTQLSRRMARGGRRANVVYMRGEPVPGAPQVKLLEARFADLVPDSRGSAGQQRSYYTGLEPAEMFVAQIDAGSPADLAGLRPGDLITRLDGAPVEHWMDLDQRLQSRPDHTFTIEWRRPTGDGQVRTITAQLTQVRRKLFDEYGNTIERLTFGAHSDIVRGQGALVPIQGRLLWAVARSVERTGETIGAMVSGFFTIISGRAASDSMGGPLMMYRVASVSGHKGWDSFLLMLALISVNLGLINLLPIPVLDGGHLLIFLVEGVRRRPLSAKARSRIQMAGLLLVAVITILALRSDIMRYVIR